MAENTEILKDDDLPISGDKISDNIKDTVREAQRLITYVANQGVIKMDEEALKVIIRSKYLLEEEKWSINAEINFWTMFDKVTAQINPVSIKSLESIVPKKDKKGDPKKKMKTEATIAVRFYRTLALVCMVVLLISQIYWVIGSDLKQNLNSVFNKREEIQMELEQMKSFKMATTSDNKTSNESSNETIKSQREYQAESELEILNQKLDANYELLLGWNRVWQFILGKDQFFGKVTKYVQTKHDTKIQQLEENLTAARNTNDKKYIESNIEKEKLRHALDIARNKMFLTELSADFVLRAFQIYLLPLLYGLLGAATFVLRTLSTEIKNLTFTIESSIRFGLRLSLGALGGMAIGWFLKPDEIDIVSSLSPLAIAFLVGYNVDLLFTTMDKIISNLTNKVNAPPPTPESSSTQKTGPTPVPPKPESSSTQKTGPTPVLPKPESSSTQKTGPSPASSPQPGHQDEPVG